MAVLLLRGQAAEAVLWAFSQVRVVIETCGNKGRGRAPANAACSGSSNMMINIIPNSIVSHMELNSITTIANAYNI